MPSASRPGGVLYTFRLRTSAYFNTATQDGFRATRSAQMLTRTTSNECVTPVKYCRRAKHRRFPCLPLNITPHASSLHIVDPHAAYLCTSTSTYVYLSLPTEPLLPPPLPPRVQRWRERRLLPKPSYRARRGPRSRPFGGRGTAKSTATSTSQPNHSSRAGSHSCSGHGYSRQHRLASFHSLIRRRAKVHYCGPSRISTLGCCPIILKMPSAPSSEPELQLYLVASTLRSATQSLVSQC